MTIDIDAVSYPAHDICVIDARPTIVVPLAEASPVNINGAPYSEYTIKVVGNSAHLEVPLGPPMPAFVTPSGDSVSMDTPSNFEVDFTILDEMDRRIDSLISEISSRIHSPAKIIDLATERAHRRP